MSSHHKPVRAPHTRVGEKNCGAGSRVCKMVVASKNSTWGAVRASADARVHDCRRPPMFGVDGCYLSGNTGGPEAIVQLAIAAQEVVGVDRVFSICHNPGIGKNGNLVFHHRWTQDYPTTRPMRLFSETDEVCPGDTLIVPTIRSCPKLYVDQNASVWHWVLGRGRVPIEQEARAPCHPLAHNHWTSAAAGGSPIVRPYLSGSIVEMAMAAPMTSAAAASSAQRRWWAVEDLAFERELSAHQQGGRANQRGSGSNGCRGGALACKERIVVFNHDIARPRGAPGKLLLRAALARCGGEYCARTESGRGSRMARGWDITASAHELPPARAGKRRASSTRRSSYPLASSRPGWRGCTDGRWSSSHSACRWRAACPRARCSCTARAQCHPNATPPPCCCRGRSGCRSRRRSTARS